VAMYCDGADHQRRFLLGQVTDHNAAKARAVAAKAAERAEADRQAAEYM